MGIPLFFKIISDKYPEIIKDIEKNNINKNLFLNLNCAIHPCCHEIINNYNSGLNKEKLENKMITEVLNYIEKLTKLVDPSLLYISIDGVAPCAKMNQQRLRRYKSVYEKKIVNDIKQKLDALENKLEWNTNAISPGTPFMKRLNDRIMGEINSNKLYSNIELFFDSSNVPGEGEHKILKFIRETKLEGDIIIYGLDADLIMLSLVSNKDNIYLLRESLELNKRIPDKFLYLDIDCLKYFILLELKERILNYDESYRFKIEDSTNLIHDYIFICFILGNDFIPHLESLSLRSGGLDIIMDIYISIYVNYGISIVDSKKKINNTFLKTFFKKLSLIENKTLIAMSNKRRRFKLRSDCDTELERQLELLNNKPIIDQIGEDYIDIGKKGWESRYYEKCLNIYDEEDVENACENYVTGLKWTFEYYFKGCSNWTWKYNYRHAPTLKDISKYLETININSIVIKPSKPYNSVVQLLSIFPKQNIDLIPDKFKILMKKKSDIIDFYPEKFDLDTYYKRYFWQCEPILPIIDFDRIIESVKSIKLYPQEKKELKFGEVYYKGKQ